MAEQKLSPTCARPKTEIAVKASSVKRAARLLHVFRLWRPASQRHSYTTYAS